MPAASTLTYRREAGASLAEAVARARSEGGGCAVLFAGGTPAQRREALEALGTHTGLSVHQVALSSLLGERPEQTRGNLRETFDQVNPDGTLLYLDEGDAFVAAVEDAPDAEFEDADALTSVRYLFQRMRAYRGVVVLVLETPGHEAEAREAELDLVVAFDG